MTPVVPIVAAALLLGIAPAALADSVTADDDAITSIPNHGPLLSKNFAGYVNAGSGGLEAFYWLVESENDPAMDPVVLWLNGGPGCSSLLGMLTELGPYVFRHDGKLVKNSFRWTTNATIIFLESPGGVGFSKAGDVKVWNDDKTAKFNYAALQAVFERHPKLKSNPFYLAGESYAGHYVPQLVQQILHGTDTGLRSRTKGFMTGNPCTGNIGCANPDPTLNYFMKYHGFVAFDDRVSAPDLAKVPYDPYDLLVPTCVKKMEVAVTQFLKNLSHFDYLRWKLLGANVDGLPTPPEPYGPCAQNYLTNFLNNDAVKKAIHADKTINWSMCVDFNYTSNPKGVTDIYQEVMQKTNWNIMVYSGTADSVVNFVQTEVIVAGMNDKLNQTSMLPWYYPDLYTEGKHQLGGFMIVYQRMSWVGVRDAGHMVPQYNPPAAKQLFTDFLKQGRPPIPGSEEMPHTPPLA